MLTAVRERFRRTTDRPRGGRAAHRSAGPVTGPIGVDPRAALGGKRCHDLASLADDGHTGSGTLTALPDALLPFAGADTMSTTLLFGRAQSVAARWTLADVEEVVPSLANGIAQGRGGRLAFRLAVELARGGRYAEAAAIARGAAEAVDTVCKRVLVAAERGKAGWLERTVGPAASLLPALGAVPELCDKERSGPVAEALAPLMDAVVRLVHLMPIYAGTQEGARVVAGEVRRAGRGEPSGLRLVLSSVETSRRPALARALVEAVGRFAATETRRSRSARAANSLLGLSVFADIFEDDPCRLARAGDALVRIAGGPSVSVAAKRLHELLEDASPSARGLLAVGVLLAAARARRSGDPTELRAAVVALAPGEGFPTDLLERMRRPSRDRRGEANAESGEADDDPTFRDLPPLAAP